MGLYHHTRQPTKTLVSVMWRQTTPVKDANNLLSGAGRLLSERCASPLSPVGVLRATQHNPRPPT